MIDRNRQLWAPKASA